ncbi:MAG: hypothetical protein ACOX1P_23140 [Thermoguttaceae bacterium]|jgi:hypothetical protein
MNVDVLTGWAMRHLALLKSRKAIMQAGLKPAQVEEKLGWLRAFEPQIGRWGELLAVVEAAEHYIRHEGLYQDVLTEPKRVCPSLRRVRRSKCADNCWSLCGNKGVKLTSGKGCWAPARCSSRQLASSSTWLASAVNMECHVEI